MKKVLFLTPELPYPPNSGGKLKSWKLLQFLSQHYEVSVATILKADDRDHVLEFLQHVVIKDFYFDSVQISRSPLNLVKSYLKRIPLNVYRTYSSYFASQVAQHIHEYDLVLSDHYEVFQYIPLDFKGKIILHEHNAYYLMWERYAHSFCNPPLHRIVSFLEAKRVKDYEKNSCHRSDLIFAAPNDIDSLIGIGVPEEKFRYTYHLGDDSQVLLPQLKFDDTSETLLYVGSLNWEANIDGLLWFLKQVWPGLKQNRPHLKLTIVGKNPSQRLLTTAEPWPDIQFVGYVEDLEDYFTNSRVFIAPLLYGAGMKVKVINAMCRGIPIVTTSIGAEGLAVDNLKHLAIVDDPQVMINTIERLLADKTLWDQLSLHSRELIIEKYTWNQLFQDMKSEIEMILNPPINNEMI